MIRRRRRRDTHHFLTSLRFLHNIHHHLHRLHKPKFLRFLLDLRYLLVQKLHLRSLLFLHR
jgi:hypothetical protein